jgi:DNA polymerase-1
MRLLAHLSKDRDLIRAFQDADSSGGDFFVEIGKELYNDPDFTKEDPRRNPVKNTMYGLSYGAGIAKLAETAGVPESQVAPVYNGIVQRFPGIKRFSNEIINLGDKREQKEGYGYVELDDNRRLACDPGFSYKLSNYVIQGSAAVIFKRGLVRLDMAGYGDVMVLPVHDEIVLDIEEGDVEYAKEEVPALLADMNYDVPLSADSEGPFVNWGRDKNE